MWLFGFGTRICLLFFLTVWSFMLILCLLLVIQVPLLVRRDASNVNQSALRSNCRAFGSCDMLLRVAHFLVLLLPLGPVFSVIGWSLTYNICRLTFSLRYK
ncbi:hypothetical protein BJ508DRAFT_56991 [Ascobolus immersus RN42]|uniref:Uncharacterized protein n=1 Tax=Ascobolus immersus RN42 TaxID=1160509 RepID=A0A3N4IPZ9_ASCIM|nr:hypothetical protein BJ508DRAFT_56991 [Ascobolus immersus RN42]